MTEPLKTDLGGNSEVALVPFSESICVYCQAPIIQRDVQNLHPQN